MPTRDIHIPDDLLHLKPSEALESVSMSRLARTGTAMLRQLTENAQAVAVKVQGQGAMVTLSQRQYDEMISLIQQLQEEQSEDGFLAVLSQQFDSLTAGMNQPNATEQALFSDPENLNEHYRPGDTESTD
jgi:predicted transcriptional regulator